MQRLIPISIVVLGVWLVSGLGSFPDDRSPVAAVRAAQGLGDGAGPAMLDRLISSGFPREW